MTTVKATSLIQRAKSSADEEAKRRDQVLIKISMLQVEEGFNVRGVGMTDAEYWAQEHVVEHVRSIADAYIAGAYIPPIVVKYSPDKEVAFIRDGHHRYQGILLAQSEGHDIQYIAIAECKGDEATQQLIMLNSSNTLALSAVERAEIYHRLYTYGFDLPEIAKKVNKSTQHVTTLMRVYDLPIDTKKLIQLGKLSVNKALTPPKDIERNKKRKENKKATEAVLDAFLAVEPEQVVVENGIANIKISADIWIEFLRVQEETKADAERLEAEKEFIKNQGALNLDEVA